MSNIEVDNNCVTTQGWINLVHQVSSQHKNNVKWDCLFRELTFQYKSAKTDTFRIEMSRHPCFYFEGQPTEQSPISHYFVLA